MAKIASLSIRLLTSLRPAILRKLQERDGFILVELKEVHGFGIVDHRRDLCEEGNVLNAGSPKFLIYQ